MNEIVESCETPLGCNLPRVQVSFADCNISRVHVAIHPGRPTYQDGSDTPEASQDVVRIYSEYAKVEQVFLKCFECCIGQRKDFLLDCLCMRRKSVKSMYSSIFEMEKQKERLYKWLEEHVQEIEQGTRPLIDLIAIVHILRSVTLHSLKIHILKIRWDSENPIPKPDHANLLFFYSSVHQWAAMQKGMDGWFREWDRQLREAKKVIVDVSETLSRIQKIGPGELVDIEQRDADEIKHTLSEHHDIISWLDGLIGSIDHPSPITPKGIESTKRKGYNPLQFYKRLIKSP